MISRETVRPRPEYITDEMFGLWKQKGFNLHYLPNIELFNNDNFVLSRSNTELLKTTQPTNQSHTCSGRWVLVENINLKRSRTPWINSMDTYFLTLFGIKLKKWLQKRTQPHSRTDTLSEILTRHDHYSRFCMNFSEVNIILSEVRELLNLPNNTHVRLPHYAEYCYLSKNFYPEWNQSKTWEWLEDTRKDGQHLATGYGTWNIIGYDPTEFWSTILGFRVIVEL